MIILKRNFCQNNQADHISFDKQSVQTTVSQIIYCYVIDEATTMH